MGKSIVIILSVMILSNSFAFEQKSFVCQEEFSQKIDSFNNHSKESSEEQREGIYSAYGYYWLTQVLGKPTANFVIAVVPGAIPAVLTISAVEWFFDFLKNEKGYLGAYVILSMAQYETFELEQLEDYESEFELDEKKSHNLFRRFVKRVNKKYRNTDFSYEEVRQAVISLSQRDDSLCNKRGKTRPVTLKKLIRLTKKELNRNK